MDMDIDQIGDVEGLNVPMHIDRNNASDDEAHNRTLLPNNPTAAIVPPIAPRKSANPFATRKERRMYFSNSAELSRPTGPLPRLFRRAGQIAQKRLAAHKNGEDGGRSSDDNDLDTSAFQNLNISERTDSDDNFCGELAPANPIVDPPLTKPDLSTPRGKFSACRSKLLFESHSNCTYTPYRLLDC